MYGANSESNATMNDHITNHHIFSAIVTIIVMVTCLFPVDLWFYGNSIIKVSDVNSFDQNIAPTWINAICIEGEERCSDAKVFPFYSVFLSSQKFADFQLSPDIDLDLKVMEMHVFDLHKMEVNLRWISNFDSSEFDVLSIFNPNQLRSIHIILFQKLTDPPHETLTINFSFSLENYVCAVNKLHHVFDFNTIFTISVLCWILSFCCLWLEVPPVLWKQQSSINDNLDITDVA